MSLSLESKIESVHRDAVWNRLPRWLSVAILLIAAPTASANLDPILTRQYFQEADALCRKDDGRLWGVSLCGPMLFVDPASHTAVANQADREGHLAPTDGVFQGNLPQSVNVSNTAVEWAGVKWTMIAWPLPADSGERGVLMAHELWHRIQSDLGLPMSNPSNAHLDTMEGRIWLQLEWRALEKALQSQPDSRRAEQDALIFRDYRRQLFAGAAGEEGALELNEGLAEYTGFRLDNSSTDAEVTAAIKRLEQGPGFSSFVRSFAYVSGPAYGILLDEAATGWRKNLKPGDDLGNILAKVIAFQPPKDLKAAAFENAKRYGGDELRAAESARRARRQKTMNEYRARLVDGPVLAIPLRKMNVQFNPTTLIPLGDLGTVYPTLRITDEWGILTVSKGALLAADWTKVTVSAPTQIGPGKPEGVGWRLKLNQGWTAVLSKRKGDLTLQRKE